jgi:2-polyprenyl-6-methoxyphenol hydroxylase-like FAD-dependent oxidoreductase
MAEFRREHEIGVHGFPQANMFHQPDLEELMLARVEQHPLIDFRRGAEVCGLDDPGGPVTAAPVRVRALIGGEETAQTVTGRFVLGCDGANSTIRELVGVPMEDLGFTERWLVIDIRAKAPLDTWDGVEQVCDPARAATFMQVTGDRYRWEFQLRDGEDQAGLIDPQALGRLLRPWTGRGDLDGLEITRAATYTFRARLAARFQAGHVFLLGDAAHLTPPFIGQGLAAGLRDAGNLAWKLAHVLTGHAGEHLLATYDTERRPHAKAMVKMAVRVGWAMTGGQDKTAAFRRIALARGRPERPHPRRHRLHPDPAAQNRRFAAHPAAPPPGRHPRRAAARRPDPQPAGHHRGPRSGPAGRHPRRPRCRADRAAARRRTGGLLPPARAHPRADQQHHARPPKPRTVRRGPPRRLDRRPARRRRMARWPAGPGGQPSAGGHRAPRWRGRGGRNPVPTATPALAHPGLCPRQTPGNGSPASTGRFRRPVPGHPLGGPVFVTVSLLLAAACLLPAAGKLLGHPKMRQSATHFEIPWPRYRLIGAAELAAAAGILTGLWWHPLGLAAAAGMALLLLGAVIAHRRAADTGKDMAPALLTLAITLAYLSVAVIS